MPSTFEALNYLYPNLRDADDWTITGNEDGTSFISRWNVDRLGPQPTQAQLDAVTQQQIDISRLVQLRDQAKQFFAAQQHDSAVIRAFMLLVMDELNDHAVKTNAILTAIDNASSLAQLKTAVAAITDLPIRTAPQLRQAVETKINAGDADT